jgi:hypothetical protein
VTAKPQPPIEQRTCRICDRAFRSIRLRVEHERDDHGVTEPDVRPRQNDRDFLRAVMAMTAPVPRGPAVASIAETLGLTPRAVRARVAKLLARNLVYYDAEDGLLLTAAGRALAKPLRQRKAS